MAVIPIDQVLSEFQPNQDNTAQTYSRWGRGDFASIVLSEFQPNQDNTAQSYSRWGRGDFASIVLSEFQPNQDRVAQSYTRWGRGNFTSPANAYLPQPTATRQYTYRGRVGGEYVYSIGSPPPGATDVTIVGGVKG